MSLAGALAAARRAARRGRRSQISRRFSPLPPPPVILPPMHRCLSFLCALSLALICCGQALAAKIEKVEVKGLNEEMTANVLAALSLQAATGKTVSNRRMRHLVRIAAEETREALEPFGYYSPRVAVRRSDRDADESDRRAAQAAQADAASDHEDDEDAEVSAGNRKHSTQPVVVTVTVAAGTPVKVRNDTIAISGQGGRDRYLERELDAFRPRTGDIFDHGRYEASKTRITRRLAERGYFDADFIAHRVEITRAEHAADIDLRWNGGDRYNMGPVSFVQTPKPIIRTSLLEKLIYWEQGQYYHQGRLDRLRQSLQRLDYFSAIDIEPHPDQAVGEREVPVTATLTPAKRSIYSAGLSYGTDSGSGVSLGMERRYLNNRGHKGLFQIDWLQKRKTATVQYRVPAFAWLDGWYTGSLQYADEQTDYIDSRRIEFVASRSGQYSRRLNLVAALHALRERWAYEYEDDGNPGTPVDYRYASYLFPSLNAEYTDVDDRLSPRRGIGGSLTLRGGLKNVGSDASFAQSHLRASWFKGLGPNDRLIVRGEIGHTFANNVQQMPPSLRFYAGGDRSIRGYNWREVGPRILDRNGKVAFALGAKHVITASLEYERYIHGPWGVAVFIDSGDAFGGSDTVPTADGGSIQRRRDRPDFHTGVGIGARWKSPVGPVKVDIARGLNNPDSPFTISLSIGSDL